MSEEIITELKNDKWNILLRFEDDEDAIIENFLNTELVPIQNSLFMIRVHYKPEKKKHGICALAKF